MLQEVKERREDYRDKKEDRNSMMQLVTSVVAGIGSSVASYLESKKTPPPPVKTQKRNRGMRVDLSSDSEPES